MHHRNNFNKSQRNYFLLFYPYDKYETSLYSKICLKTYQEALYSDIYFYYPFSLLNSENLLEVAKKAKHISL